MSEKKTCVVCDRTFPIEEFLSNTDGNDSENSVLNGVGGWYYNNKNGNVKLNLLRPIKHYCKLYFGQYRSDIPSEW